VSEQDEQRPPYEEVLDEPPTVVDAVPMTKRPQPTRPQPDRAQARPPGRERVVEVIPNEPQTWTEARVMRLAFLALGTVFVVVFVTVAADVLAYYAWGLMWLPFLVGALPYLGFYAVAQRQHLNDESSSRTRRENFEQSRFDMTPLDQMGADTDRYR
jgi:hypothetical protein